MDIYEKEESEQAELRTSDWLEHAYAEAKCEKPHPGGSACFPTWIGYGYVCPVRFTTQKR